MNESPRFRLIRPLFYLCIGVSLMLPTRLPAAAKGSETTNSIAALGAAINQHIGEKRFDAAAWGIAVVSLDTGQMLYSHRADHLLEPASTAKLFTAALTLDELGGNDHFPTRLVSNGRLRDGRLDGSLVLYGTGDPTLGTESSAHWADQLATQVAAHGIRVVHGSLVADDSYFSGQPFGSGWEVDDLQSWFAVPSSALSVQENIVKVTATPASLANRPVQLEFEPKDAAPPLQGQIITGASHTANDINFYRAAGQTTLHVFGSMAEGTPPAHFKLAVADPAILAGRQLREALQKHGVHVTGKLRVLHWPEQDTTLLARANTLAEVDSPRLMDVLQRGLKRSQNLYLQNLLLNVGVHEQAGNTTPMHGFLSSEGWAMRAMRHLLDKIGIPASATQLHEGTGLSRRDLVTPNALTRILVYLAAQQYAAQLQQALPIAGVDGTLKYHMRGTAAADNVHAKTGSMSYVHCLAGYVTSGSGERLAFAIMLNNYHRPARAPRTSSDVDAIAVMLANFHGHS